MNRRQRRAQAAVLRKKKLFSFKTPTFAANQKSPTLESFELYGQGLKGSKESKESSDEASI